jgi:Transmembrane family 220, helix
MKKIINIIYAIIFALFAFVQYNDPDPWLWIPLYAVISVLAILALFGKYYSGITLIWAVLCLGWALYLSPGVYDWFAHHSTNEIFENMQPGKVFIEEARECFGLVLAALALWSLYRQGKNAAFRP